MLENMGVQFVFEGNTKYTPVRMKAYASAEQVRHPVAPAPGCKVAPRVASAMTKVMTERFLELGGDLRLESPVTSVIMENGHAVGVKAKAPDGEEIEAYAGAVILACGGSAIIQDDQG
jgi:fumarate reductase flavoprotein subunit